MDGGLYCCLICEEFRDGDLSVEEERWGGRGRI
jgi:hypothetical protein